MKKFYIIFGIISELVILIGLIWQHFGLDDIDTAILILLLATPFLAVAHWISNGKKQLTKLMRMKISFITLPSILLCFTLILSLAYSLNKDMRVGPSKEFRDMAIAEGVPVEQFLQWYNGKVEKMKSELLIYVILLVSLCLLYKARYSTSLDQATKRNDVRSKYPPGIKSDKNSMTAG